MQMAADYFIIWRQLLVILIWSYGRSTSQARVLPDFHSNDTLEWIYANGECWKATSEGVSSVKFIAKFQNLNFWHFFFLICNFDFALFWLRIWCESLIWVIMGRRGLSQNAGVLVVLVSLVWNISDFVEVCVWSFKPWRLSDAYIYIYTFVN